MGGGLEIAPETVREQLDRILSSAAFQSARQLSRFLQFVVEEALAGRSEQLKAYTIATGVLGKESDYDPQTDATVRILAGRLRARLDQYYGDSGKNDLVRITVPKGAYVPVFESLGASADGQSGQAGRHEGFAVSHKPSIVVLPFTNFNSDLEEGCFARGLTERLILNLGSYDCLTVLPRWATMGHSDHSDDAHHSDRFWGSRFLMEGSVRRIGQTMRVSVYLSDAILRRQIWTEAYERAFTADNLVAVEDEIAHHVIIRIADVYGGVISRIAGKESQERKEPENPTVYDALLHYIHFFSELSTKSYLRALHVLEKAYKNKPDNPELCAMMSTVYRAGYGFGFSREGNPLDKVLQLARKAVSLDPRSRDARIALAGAYQLGRDRLGMIRESEALLSIRASGTRFALAGWNLALAGEWERGLTILRAQMRLLPYYPGWFRIATCLDHYRRVEYEEALMEAHRMNTPIIYWEPLLRAAALGQLGRAAEARLDLRELLELRPDFPADPRRYLNWLIPLDDLVDHVLEGIEKAGLALT